MKVMVTGATGFVGRHVVAELIARGHSVIAIARDTARAKEMPWINLVDFIECDLSKNSHILFDGKCHPDAIVHLAWAGLPNYRDFFHISQNLPSDLTFLEKAVNSGVRHILVAGTCLEYGMQYGPLTEDMETSPSTSYGLAKDSLRKSLQILQNAKPFTFQWMRLFYMYGEGQNINSLLSQLDRAIDEGQSVFNMSFGDQLRDYLPIREVAKYFSLALENPNVEGVINCCSGKPISVYDLVKQYCHSKDCDIILNRGYYDYPNYEPLAFWGSSTKLASLEKM